MIVPLVMIGFLSGFVLTKKEERKEREGKKGEEKRVDQVEKKAYQGSEKGNQANPMTKSKMTKTKMKKTKRTKTKMTK